MKNLTLYSEKKYLPTQCKPIALLYPFWGQPEENPDNIIAGRYTNYVQIGKDFLNITDSIDQADLAVLPIPWETVLINNEAKQSADEFLLFAKQAGKKTIIFFWSDSTETVPTKDTIVFRTSFYQSNKQVNEFAMPAFVEDLTSKYFSDQIPVRQKHEKPVIGFCGVSAPLHEKQITKLKTKTRNMIDRLKGYQISINPGLDIRAKAIRSCLKNSRVETNFILRNAFLGGTHQINGKIDVEKRKQIRLEYIKNLEQSDYVIVARGAGNFSYRFYETLSCSRIPIFINTDCVLPNQQWVDWKKHFVWVEEKEIKHLADIVADFHNQLSEQDFIDLQINCHALWKQQLSPEGFFKHFYKHFPN